MHETKILVNGEMKAMSELHVLEKCGVSSKILGEYEMVSDVEILKSLRISRILVSHKKQGTDEKQSRSNTCMQMVKDCSITRRITSTCVLCLGHYSIKGKGNHGNGCCLTLG